MTGIRNVFLTFKNNNENVLDYFLDYEKSEDAADEVISNFKQKMDEPLIRLIQNFIEDSDGNPQSIAFLAERIKLHDKKLAFDEQLNKILNKTILDLTRHLITKHIDTNKKNRFYLILAFIYHYGCGSHIINIETSIKFYDKIKEIFPIALANLGLLREKLLIQSDKNIDSKEIVTFYQQAVELNNPYATINLGRLYKKGYIVEQNFKKAKKLFTDAATFHNPYALTELGIIFHYGLGVKKNKKLAEEYFKRAAIFGDPKGLNELGTLYFIEALKRIKHNPDELTKPQTIILFTKADEYVNLAAEYGCIEAMKNYGRMNNIGFSHGPNKDTAAAYYRRFLLFANDNIDDLFKSLLLLSKYDTNIHEKNKIVITQVNQSDAAIFYYWAMASSNVEILNHAFYADSKVASSLFDKELKCHLTKESALRIMTKYIQIKHEIFDPLQEKIISLTHHRHKYHKRHRLSENNSIHAKPKKLSSIECNLTKSSDSEELFLSQSIDATFFNKINKLTESQKTTVLNTEHKNSPSTSSTEEQHLILKRK